MKINAQRGSLADVQCDALIINIFEGIKHPGGGTGAVDKALDGAVSQRIAEEEFEGKLGKCLVVRPCSDFPARKIVVVGLGKSENFGEAQIMKAAAAAVRKCQKLKAVKVASILHGAGIAGLPSYECARATALGSALGAYEFIEWKTEDVKPSTIESLDIIEISKEKMPDIQRGIDSAAVIADAVTFARDLINNPSNVVTPSYLASIAETIADVSGIKLKIMDRAEFEAAGMGLYAAVARGAAQEPKFIELKYEHPEADKTIALIGKGITFDTGGHSLKGTDSMYRMKDDMSGAAAVLATMRSIDKVKPKVNVIGIVAATENAIGSRAIHPGDCFKSLNGKTVEVNNTDAEGRLTLADAVTYANNAGADEIIDLATLTGACVTALGRRVSGILGTDQELVDKLIAAGKCCGDDMWQLPLYEDYKESLKSDIADMKNSESGGGGAIIAALFIREFAGNTPWAHIDLSSAFTEKHLPLARKGGVGVGVGTLMEYLATYA